MHPSNGLGQDSTCSAASTRSRTLLSPPAQLATVCAALLLFLVPPFLADAGSAVLTVQSWTCVLACIAFKLLSLAMGRGVLARELAAGASWWRLLGAALLPIIPLHPGSFAVPDAAALLAAAPGKPSSLALRKLQAGMLKLCAFSCITVAGIRAYTRLHDGSHTGSSSSDIHSSSAQPGGRLWAATVTLFSSPLFARFVVAPLLNHLGGAALWLEVDGMGDLVDAAAIWIFGIHHLEPHFDWPMMSTSLGQFWSRRWNLSMSSMLRDMVYEPVLEGQVIKTWPVIDTPGPPLQLPDARLPQAQKESGVSTVQAASPAAEPTSSGSLDGTATLVVRAAAGFQKEGEKPRQLAPAGPGPDDACATSDPDESAGAPGSTDDGAAKYDAATSFMRSCSSSTTCSGTTTTTAAKVDAAPAAKAGLTIGTLTSGTTGAEAPAAPVPAAQAVAKRPTRLRRLVAGVSAFGFSGLWHELVFAHMTGGFTTGGVWTLFFVLQAPAIFLEGKLKSRARKAGIRMPTWLSIVLVNMLVMWAETACWMPPMLKPLPAYGCKPSLGPSVLGHVEITPCPPTSTLLERIMYQAQRDLDTMQARAATVLLPLVKATSVVVPGLGEAGTGNGGMTGALSASGLGTLGLGEGLREWWGAGAAYFGYRGSAPSDAT